MNIKNAILSVLLLSCVSSQCLALSTTLVVGDGPTNTKSWEGPSTDYTFTDNQHAFGQSVAIHSESSIIRLATYDWSGIADTGPVYCTKSGTHSDLQLTNNYTASGLTSPDGHTLYKTSVTGLYFATQVTTLVVANINIAESSFWMEQKTKEIVSTGYYNDSTKRSCEGLADSRYLYMGNIMYGIKIYLYADSTFAPTDSALQNFVLTKNGNVDFYINNPNSGAMRSYKINFVLPAKGLKAVWPTCTASTVGGSAVSGTNTIKLGSYYPKQIKDGLSPVKFSIDLKSCSYVNNMQVKLTSGNVGKNNTSLLGNGSKNSTPASGIGVLIEGLKNNVSAQMTLKPNDSSSIYKESNNNSGEGSPVGSTTKSLYFQATLKPDGTSATITPGDFKATGKFTISYP
jgi:P pilus assembly protein, pilin FimA